MPNDDEDSECLVGKSADGQTVHLWMKARDDGNMWVWLKESPLEPVYVTPAEAQHALNTWATLRDYMERGEHTDQKYATIFRGVDSGRKTVLVFSLDNGHMTYWRDGETLEPIPLALHAVEELINTWDSVATQARRADDAT